jgi:hypothetical protein
MRLRLWVGLWLVLALFCGLVFLARGGFYDPGDHGDGPVVY